jgi:hypothetical protein
VTPAAWWTALKGYARFRRAMLDGNIASAADARARLIAHCATCDTRRRRRLALPGLPDRVYWTCGKEFEEIPGVACGCIVAAEDDAGDAGAISLTVEGQAVRAVAAGKLLVADGPDGECPAGRYGAVARDRSVGLLRRALWGLMGAR